MSKLSTIIYKPDAKSRFTLAGAASAVALRKGLWRDKQGFSVRRTPVRRSRKPAENAEQGKKGHFWMDTNYNLNYSCCFYVRSNIGHLIKNIFQYYRRQLPIS